MYKRILVGIDDSQDAKDALDKALEISNEDGSEVIVFHSVVRDVTALMPAFSFAGPSNGVISYLIRRDEANQGATLLKDAEKLFADHGKKIETRLIFDISPKDYINKISKEEKFDLVILGCKGKHSKIKRAILGTTPTEVINSAPSDVLIVR
ncbi:MAG: universal stress protein [Candidatus Lokiarchaeota archaeon]|jgi:nucleotide-binding universal stress UspA family protein